MKGSLFHIGDMIGHHETSMRLSDGRWVRAVPRPFYHGLWGRMKGAWAVLRAQAYPVLWPSGGELEKATLSSRPKPNARPKVGDYVWFKMPVDDDGMKIDRGVISRIDGAYHYITVYLLTQLEPIEIERYENEVIIL